MGRATFGRFDKKMRKIVLLSQGMFVVFLVGLGLAPFSSAETAPSARANFVFSSKSGVIPLFVLIRTPDVPAGFRLSLDPDYDIHHNITVLVLSLRHQSDSADASNLLDPTGRSHGYQSYIFAASDFVYGARQSLYGEKRTVILDQLGLHLRIDVSKASVEVIPERSMVEPTYRFNRLSVGVDVRGGASIDHSTYAPNYAEHLPRLPRRR